MRHLSNLNAGVNRIDVLAKFIAMPCGLATSLLTLSDTVALHTGLTGATIALAGLFALVFYWRIHRVDRVKDISKSLLATAGVFAVVTGLLIATAGTYPPLRIFLGVDESENESPPAQPDSTDNGKWLDNTADSALTQLDIEDEEMCKGTLHEWRTYGFDFTDGSSELNDGVKSALIKLISGADNNVSISIDAYPDNDFLPDRASSDLGIARAAILAAFIKTIPTPFQLTLKVEGHGKGERKENDATVKICGFSEQLIQSEDLESLKM